MEKKPRTFVVKCTHSGTVQEIHTKIVPRRRPLLPLRLPLHLLFVRILILRNMTELKTKKTTGSVRTFINSVKEPQKRADAKVLLKLFKEITKETPTMWGASIVGFGQYHYKSERSSQQGDWPLVGFSPRKQNLTLYVMPGLTDMKALLKKLGKHTTSIGCLYIKRLSDVNLDVLKVVIKKGYGVMKKKYS